MPEREVHPDAPEKPEIVLEEIEHLVNTFKTVQLATVNPQGNPEASYTPYTRDFGRYYIFISGLASHTENILQHPRLSLFFIQNEAEARNPFTRKRLTLTCDATPVAREDARWTRLLEGFRTQHGATVDLLHSLPDFQLFELTPRSGRYVRGFGQAFALEGDNLNEVRPVTGK